MGGKLSKLDIFKQPDTKIKCTNIRNYKFNGRDLKVILFEVESKSLNSQMIFTIDIEVRHGSIRIVSHHTNVSDGKHVPVLLDIDDMDFLISIIQKNYMEVVQQ